MNNNHHLILHGIPFRIDYTNKRLVQDSCPAHTIPFSALEREDDFLTGHLQFLAGEDATTPEAGAATARVKMPAALLTPSWEHTPENAAAFNAQSYGQEWNVLLFDEAITRRLNGRLPIIDIAGDPFVVDWPLRELRSQADYFCRIGFGQLSLSADEEYYGGYYHIPSKQVVQPDPQLAALPEDTVWVEIPCAFYLDPIGVAREYDMHETFLLTDFPIRDNLKATVKQISEQLSFI